MKKRINKLLAMLLAIIMVASIANTENLLLYVKATGATQEEVTEATNGESKGTAMEGNGSSETIEYGQADSVLSDTFVTNTNEGNTIPTGAATDGGGTVQQAESASGGTAQQTDPVLGGTTQQTDPVAGGTAESTDQTEGETAQPAAQTEGNTTKPAAQTEGNTTQPAAQTEGNTTKPADQTEGNTTKPATQTGERTAQPAAQTTEGITQPAAQTTDGIMQQTDPSAKGTAEPPQLTVTEKTAEEEEETEETSITLSQIVDGYEVIIAADKGVLPMGAALSVYKVSGDEEKGKIEAAISTTIDKTSKTIEETVSFHITIYDKSGKEIQLDNSKGSLQVVIRNADNMTLQSPEQTLEVFHVQDDYSGAEVIGSEVAGGEISFPANQLSTYTIAILGTVTVVGTAALYDGTNLYKLNAAGEKTGDIYDGSNRNGITEIRFADGVTAIGNKAFENCTGLLSITIPSGIRIIGDDAFNNCTKLNSIVIPDTVTAIGAQAFMYCEALKNVVIPSGVTQIGYAAFRACSGLTGIEIPAGITVISESVFLDCSKLSSVILPESITVIESFAFMNCTSLTSINLPNGIVQIGMEAFAKCTALTNINLPSGITSIESYAFYNCLSFAQIIFKGKNIPTVGEKAFRISNYDSNVNIIIPANMKNVFMSKIPDSNLPMRYYITEMSQITAFAANNIVLTEPKGTPLSTIHFPSELTATVNGTDTVITGVTWKDNAAYNGNAAGEYTFTAILPDIYELSGTEAPCITISVLNTDKEITSFTIGTNTGIINQTDHTIAVTVPYGTDVTALTPVITVSSNASISPSGNTVQNFKNPLTYMVTSQYKTTQSYVVTVMTAAGTSEDTKNETGAVTVTETTSSTETITGTGTTSGTDTSAGDGTATVTAAAATTVTDPQLTGHRKTYAKRTVESTAGEQPAVTETDDAAVKEDNAKREPIEESAGEGEVSGDKTAAISSENSANASVTSQEFLEQKLGDRNVVIFLGIGIVFVAAVGSGTTMVLRKKRRNRKLH